MVPVDAPELPEAHPVSRNFNVSLNEAQADWVDKVYAARDESITRSQIIRELVEQARQAEES